MFGAESDVKIDVMIVIHDLNVWIFSFLVIEFTFLFVASIEISISMGIYYFIGSHLQLGGKGVYISFVKLEQRIDMKQKSYQTKRNICPR